MGNSSYPGAVDTFADGLEEGNLVAAVEHLASAAVALEKGLGDKPASGALTALGAISSGTGFQASATQGRHIVVPVTLSPTNGADGTVAVALSPDNVTYTTLGTLTSPTNAVAGDVRFVTLYVPAGWYVKLTAAHATIGTGIAY